MHYYKKDKKRILARVFNSPIIANKSSPIAIYSQTCIENSQKEQNSCCINANSFTELKIKPGYFL